VEDISISKKTRDKILAIFSIILIFSIIIIVNFLYPENKQQNLDVITCVFNLSLLLYIRYQTGRENFRKNTFLSVAMYYTLLKTGITIFYFSSAKETFLIENINDYTPVFIFLTLFLYLLRGK
jgi:hypothetical protein